MAIDKYASRTWRREIRDILNREWDPIGIYGVLEDAPDDEYETYAGGLAAKIRNGAPDEELIAYLEWA